MLRLPRLEVRAPETVEDVVAAMQVPGARLIAGGTDIKSEAKRS